MVRARWWALGGAKSLGCIAKQKKRGGEGVSDEKVDEVLGNDV